MKQPGALALRRVFAWLAGRSAGCQPISSMIAELQPKEIHTVSFTITARRLTLQWRCSLFQRHAQSWNKRFALTPFKKVLTKFSESPSKKFT
jgi:hypothetical protein